MCLANVPGSYGDGRRRFRAAGRAWGSLGRHCLTDSWRWLARKRKSPGRGRAALAHRSEKPTEELRHPKIPFPFSFEGNCHFPPECGKPVSGKPRVLTAEFFPPGSAPPLICPPLPPPQSVPFQLQHRGPPGPLPPPSSEDLSLLKPRTPAETYWILHWKRLRG